MWETLTNDPMNQLTGDVTVALSTIPTEYLYDADTQSIGYTYAHFSSSAEVLNAATSSTYNVTFSIPVSQYFYQIKNVQTTSDVVFLTSLLGLSGAVITAGSLFANASPSLDRPLLRSWRILFGRQQGTSCAINLTCNFLDDEIDNLCSAMDAFTPTWRTTEKREREGEKRASASFSTKECHE